MTTHGPNAKSFSNYDSIHGAAHRAFDSLWLVYGMTRDQAYAWMKKVLHISYYDAHISKLSREQCLKLMNEVQAYVARNTERLLEAKSVRTK